MTPLPPPPVGVVGVAREQSVVCVILGKFGEVRRLGSELVGEATL